MTLLEKRPALAPDIASDGEPTRRLRPSLPPRAPKVPKPPRRIPRSLQPPRPLGPRAAALRIASVLLAVMLLGFVGNLMVLSHLQHTISQQNLENELRAQLAEGTLPVSEGTVDNVLLGDGDPVAFLEIPSIGVREVIVEGSSSATTKAGAAHRRDTMLPGQAGVSVVMGRASAYGGPFGRLQELAPGEQFTVTTGQGEHTYEVIGLRYAGDPAPPPPKAGESRLILETARGPAYVPTGIARVDAILTSKAQPSGTRQTTPLALPAEDKELATDPTTAWALVFAVQLLLLVEAVAVWAYVRMGSRKTWVVFLPVGLLSGIYVADQAATLLPNLL